MMAKRRYRDPRTGRFTTKAKYQAVVRRKKRRHVPPVRKREVRAAEWQFGADYKAARRGHNVMVDVRLSFDWDATEADARKEMNRLIRGGEPSSGVSIEAVDWKSGRHLKSGDAGDLENFLSVLYVGGVDYLRAGALKEDEL